MSVCVVYVSMCVCVCVHMCCVHVLCPCVCVCTTAPYPPPPTTHYPPQTVAEDRYKSLYQTVDLTRDFYFSFTLDLTRPMQHATKHVPADEVPPREPTPPHPRNRRAVAAAAAAGQSTANRLGAENTIFVWNECVPRTPPPTNGNKHTRMHACMHARRMHTLERRWGRGSHVCVCVCVCVGVILTDSSPLW